MPQIRRFWPIILLALLPLIPLWRCVFMGEAIGPFDQIRQMSPWNGPKPAQPWDVLQADGVLQFYPWRDMVFKSWTHGQLPLWNPYELGGTPLLANSQSAGFYPLHIAVGLLHLPTGLGMTLLAWFHLFWAGLGTYLLTRRLGASKAGASVAGASFELSAFMLAWTGLPSVITTVAWIPWLLAAIHGIFDFHPLRAANIAAAQRSTALDALASFRKSSAGSWLLAALSTGMMILAGHLQFVAYGLCAAVFLTLWLTISTYPDNRREVLPITLIRMRHVAPDTSEVIDQHEGRLPWFLAPWFGGLYRTVLAVLLGFALAAPQLLPVLSYSQFSHRKNTPTAEGYEAYVAGSIKPFELANLEHAYTLGSPRDPVDVQNQTISEYWPAIAKQGDNLAESAVTLGPFVLGLLFLVPWRDRRLWPMAILGFIALLLALGTILNKPFYFLLPGWSSTGSPGRIVCLFVLAACVLAGIGFDAKPLERLKSPRALILLAPLVLFAVLTWFGNTTGLGQAPEQAVALVSSLQSQVAGHQAPQAIAEVLIAIAAMAALVVPQVAKYRRVAIAASILVCMSHALTLIMSGEPLARFESGAGSNRVAIVNSNWGLLQAARAVLPPNTASLSGIHELGGYDSLLHRDTKKLIDDINGQDSSPPANGNMVLVKPSVDVKGLADAGASEIWTLQEFPELPGGHQDPAGFWRYPISGPGRVSTAAGPGTILEETNQRLVVRATGPGRLIVRDRNMPGWLAKVDGNQVPIQGTMWREIDLPAGEHTIEFNYVPPGLMPGIYLGVPAWLLLVGLALVTRKTS